MKLHTAVAKTLLMAASLGITTPMLVTHGRAQVRPRPPVAAEEEPSVVGLEIARASGGYLGVALEGLSLVVRFYNAEKKPAVSDAARAAIWWDPVNKAGVQRTIMTRTPDLLALRSPALLRPPHVYTVSVTLVREDGETIEIHLVDLKALPEPAA
jgi:hypothetical protein